jgi:amino acid permease
MHTKSLSCLLQIIKTIFNPSGELDYLLDRRIWITVFMVTVVGPLSFSRKLDSLKYTSIIALFAVAYLCLIVVWHFVVPNFPTAPPEEIELVHFSTKFFTSLPVFVFAFTCHQNVSLAGGVQHVRGGFFWTG